MNIEAILLCVGLFIFGLVLSWVSDKIWDTVTSDKNPELEISVEDYNLSIKNQYMKNVITCKHNNKKSGKNRNLSHKIKNSDYNVRSKEIKLHPVLTNFLNKKYNGEK